MVSRADQGFACSSPRPRHPAAHRPGEGLPPSTSRSPWTQMTPAGLWQSHRSPLPRHPWAVSSRWLAARSAAPPDVFHAGIAVRPVPTGGSTTPLHERYLGDRRGTRSRYSKSHLITDTDVRRPRPHRPLMVVHGLADDTGGRTPCDWPPRYWPPARARGTAAVRCHHDPAGAGRRESPAAAFQVAF